MHSLATVIGSTDGWWRVASRHACEWTHELGFNDLYGISMWIAVYGCNNNVGAHICWNQSLGPAKGILSWEQNNEFNEITEPIELIH